ncbi:endonuclease VII domain-containing protein [Neptuniibacter sp.]|uniref:endonuclease VII domain-containing protein n=1 Tax=Neptuniibacter sp. TaxID=1962643 RepID=UPI00260418AE|nr:endonuclease VII domain-containing protein [Neptuniibacter sp.]MCP4598529.1 endonuclease VII [Neptuniibacter sp.]
MGEVADFINDTDMYGGKEFSHMPHYNCHEDRDNYLAYNFGITEQKYNAMFKKHKGRCYICGKHQSKMKKRLHVDHDHKTGKVRGLLCVICNLGLGCFKDNPARLRSAAEYLERNR